LFDDAEVWVGEEYNCDERGVYVRLWGVDGDN
jgi:hypothetical protein